MKATGFFILMGTLALFQAEGAAQANSAPAPQSIAEQHIGREVRHELVTLPRYNIFDDLEYTVSDSTVTLMGEVTDPTVKSDAEKAVRKIEGVEAVRNEIQVLPLSPMDDQLRRRIARALLNAGGLSEYFFQVQPSIRIIVDNGNVTLKGFVDNQGDKDLAAITARGIPGVFSVSNQLQVTADKGK